jgi:type VI protein secretion system component VasK
MHFFTKGLLVLAIGAISVSCSPLSRSKRAIVIDDDGKSMRYRDGKKVSKDKRWNSSDSPAKRQKKRNKAFEKRRRG